MKKIIFTLFTTLLLSSCIKMDSSLVINDDFSVESKTIFDYTMLNSMGSGISTGTGSEVKKMPCDNLTGSGGLTAGEFEEVSCKNINENVAEVTGKSNNTSKYISKIGNNYKLDLKKVTEGNSEDDGKSETEKVQSINMLKSMGFEMNYSIELPNEIIEYNIGEVDGKVINFTVFDIIGTNEEAYVIFKGNNSDSKSNVVEVKEVSFNKSKLYKELIISKKELNKTTHGRMQIVKFDKVVEKLDNKKSSEIYSKLEKVNLDDKKIEKHKNILKYLRAKLGLKLSDK